MRKSMIAALAIPTVLAGGPVGPAIGQAGEQEIVVRARSLERWVDNVDDQLTRALSVPMSEPMLEPMANDMERGMTQIAFIRGDNGHAAQVTLRQTSGHRDLDRQALEAVEHLDHLPPMPAGIPAHQPILAQIIFNLDPDSPLYQRAISAEMRAEAQIEPH